MLLFTQINPPWPCWNPFLIAAYSLRYHATNFVNTTKTSSRNPVEPFPPFLIKRWPIGNHHHQQQHHHHQESHVMSRKQWSSVRYFFLHRWDPRCPTSPWSIWRCWRKQPGCFHWKMVVSFIRHGETINGSFEMPLKRLLKKMSMRKIFVDLDSSGYLFFSNLNVQIVNLLLEHFWNLHLLSLKNIQKQKRKH